MHDSSIFILVISTCQNNYMHTCKLRTIKKKRRSETTYITAVASTTPTIPLSTGPSLLVNKTNHNRCIEYSDKLKCCINTPNDSF